MTAHLGCRIRRESSAVGWGSLGGVDRNGPARASEAKQARRDLLAAMTTLESALTEPARGDTNRAALESHVHALQRAFDEHKELVEGGTGLFADLAGAEPRLQSHVEEIRSEHSLIAEQAAGIAAAIPIEGRDPEMVGRISTLLAEIADHSRHMVSLAYDAFDTDIPAID